MQPTKLLVINEEESDPKYGHDPSARPIPVLLEYGLISLDKPRGPTSHEVVSWVRKLLDITKAGHSGTLDPPVSGLLPIGLGQATKALGLLLLYPKEYWGLMRIHSSVTRRQVDAVVKEFTGEIFQKPPQRSAVKREVRSRHVYELEIVEQKGNLYLVRCLCEAGTYIRKLFYDMGEVLGVGATMVELRRTKVGPLSEERGLVTLHELSDAVFRMKSGDESAMRNVVRPIEECIGPVKRVFIRDSAVDAICHGARLAVPGILSLSEDVSKDDTVVVLSGKGELVALGKALLSADEVESANRGLAVSIERVVMTKDTYPMMWKHQAPKRKDPKKT